MPAAPSLELFPHTSPRCALAWAAQLQREKHWSRILTGRITDDVKLVGATIRWGRMAAWALQGTAGSEACAGDRGGTQLAHAHVWPRQLHGDRVRELMHAAWVPLRARPPLQLRGRQQGRRAVRRDEAQPACAELRGGHRPGGAGGRGRGEWSRGRPAGLRPPVACLRAQSEQCDPCCGCLPAAARATSLCQLPCPALLPPAGRPGAAAGRGGRAQVLHRHPRRHLVGVPRTTCHAVPSDRGNTPICMAGVA